MLPAHWTNENSGMGVAKQSQLELRGETTAGEAMLIAQTHQNRSVFEGSYPYPGVLSPLPQLVLVASAASPTYTPRAQPGVSKSCRGAFRSPRPSPKSGQADGTIEDSQQLDIEKLKEKRGLLDKEISQFLAEGYNVDELKDHISQLHEYNDIKDVGQMLLGKLAVIRGVTTKELYPEFDLDMDD
ncbi:DNA repair protein SWI5 homolog [Rhynchocyon petersi]